MVVVKLLGIAAAMVLASVAAFIAQLYSPPFMWAAALALIIMSPFISFVRRNRLRICLCAIFSLFINANYILHIPYGNPVSQMIIFSVLLAVFIFSMIYVIMRLSHSLKESRK